MASCSSSSGPPCTSPLVDPAHVDHVRLPSGPGSQYETGQKFLLIELFAGPGALSRAIGRHLCTLPPRDLELGGVDFSDSAAVQVLHQSWQALADAGYHLLFRVAPPCASFSRARDRSYRTRLRSSAQPGGLYPEDPTTVLGNAIARLHCSNQPASNQSNLLFGRLRHNSAT